MKIGKKSKTLPIDNPFRPLTGIPRNYTICRIEFNSTLLNEEEYEYSVQVDADNVPKFKEEFTSLIPRDGWFRDETMEMWFFKEEHADLIMSVCNRVFDKTIVVGY